MAGEFYLNDDGAILINDDGQAIPCDECPCVPSPCANGWPQLSVTLTWTDADVTKTYMGQTFTNGQTIEFCPQSYSRGEDVFGSFYEFAYFPYTVVQISLQAFNNNAATAEARVRVTNNTFSLYVRDRNFPSPFVRFTNTSNLSAYSLASNILPAVDGAITDGAFGQLTTADGLTVSWARTTSGDWG